MSQPVADLVTPSSLSAMSPRVRRQVVSVATEAIRAHGIEGLLSEPHTDSDIPRTRAERRRIARAQGYRGRKFFAKDPQKATEEIAQRRAQIVQAMVMDEALTAANARLHMGALQRAKLRVQERG